MMLKKILVLLFLISSFSFAEVASTDIKVLVELIKSETKANRDLIKANRDLIRSEIKATRDLIKANRDLIRSEIKATHDLIKANRDLMIANQKATNQRFEDMQKYSDKRFDDVNKRFNDVNKRFDDANKRFDTLTTFLGLLFTTMIGGFTAIMWYLVKEKKDIKESVQESVQEKVQDNIEEKLQLRLEKKADKKLVDSIMKIFEDFAKTNIEIANVLQQHRIRVS